MVEVGEYEKKTVTDLNNELFLKAKELMQEGTDKPNRLGHIGWGEVGDFIDWLEDNYKIEKRD